MSRLWTWVQSVILGQSRLRAEYERGWLDGYDKAREEAERFGTVPQDWEFEF